MKSIACLYCEGTDAKIAVLSKEKTGIRIVRTASLTMSRVSQSTAQGRTNALAEIEKESMGSLTSDDLSFDSLEASDGVGQHHQLEDTSDVALFNSALSGLKVTNIDFIPIVTEPTVNYHHYEGPLGTNKKKLIQAVVADILVSKGITAEPDLVDIVSTNDKTSLALFLEGDIHCVGLINQLANYNNKRYLKIPTIKSAELALSYYVSKTNKFFPEDFSLIVYIGKEYSKLIFLEGQKLKHIGSTLDIGTKNLHTYDVYFSKILLEMENGGVPKLDNIIICGEDRSENLILSFFGTFPEANVTELKFDGFDTSLLNEEDAQNLALYAMPISVGIEYYDEIDKLHVGANFLPKYVQENQKTFQFAWHGYLLVALLFIATFFFTFHILSNVRQIKDLDYEIERLQQRQAQDQALAAEINPLTVKINAFDATQGIIDSASVGAGLWNKNLTKLSDFMERRRSFWFTKIEPTNPEELKLTGYALSRSVLTEFAEQNITSILKNINYEPLREKSAFSFSMDFRMNGDTTKAK